MKKKVLINAHVEADLDAAISWSRDIADYANRLERAVKEFHDFVRDHRSMDWVNLSVIRDYEDQCEHCGEKWENSIDDDGVPVCCGKAIEEHEAKIKSPLTGASGHRP